MASQSEAEDTTPVPDAEFRATLDPQAGATAAPAAASDKDWADLIAEQDAMIAPVEKAGISPGEYMCIELYQKKGKQGDVGTPQEFAAFTAVLLTKKPLCVRAVALQQQLAVLQADFETLRDSVDPDIASTIGELKEREDSLDEVDDHIEEAELDEAAAKLSSFPSDDAIRQAIASAAGSSTQAQAVDPEDQQKITELSTGFGNLWHSPDLGGNLVDQIDPRTFSLDQLPILDLVTQQIALKANEDVKDDFHRFVEEALENCQTLEPCDPSWEIDGVRINVSKPTIAIVSPKIGDSDGQPCTSLLSQECRAFGGGLIGFYAGVEIPDAAGDGWQVRLVQDCKCRREATYTNGAKVRREFDFVQDIVPEWKPLNAGGRTVVRLTDEPKWQWFKHHEAEWPAAVDISDGFRVFLVVKTPAGTELSLFMVEWQFAGSLNGASYTIDRITMLSGTNLGGLTNTGPFANNVGLDVWHGN